jgi:signal transduction histidine kinase/ActR/RegA family two-component response regulator
VATTLGLQPDAVITIDHNGLARCVSGELVHEPDVAAVLSFPFCQRLADAGLRSLVAVPLVVDQGVIAIFLLAQRRAGAFSSTDCEFLKQLGEHVALAAAQSKLHHALQKAYDELRLSQQAMLQQERLRALGQMAGGIAHDINNAIAPALLYTDWIIEKDAELSEQTRKQLTTVKRAIEDVALTVARLREFFRRDDPQAAPGQVDLNEVVMEVLDLTRARWSDMPQQRGIAIVLDTDLRAGLPNILGIASEIREALINLLFNAVDAMPKGGTLTVRTRCSDHQHVALEVRDTGIGMNADTRQRCLEPFFTTKGEGGTGIGLAMVYGIAQRHGADIVIESVENAGTTMGLVFPLPAALLVPSLVSAPIARIRTLRILVIDDDPRLLQTLTDLLDLDGHQVTRAVDGKAGVEAFLAAKAAGILPEVVITDLGMPYLDGTLVAKAVKAASPGTPVILLTGWGQRLIGGSVTADIDRIVDKPPTLQSLRKALAEVMNTPALLIGSMVKPAAPTGVPPSLSA